MRGFRAMRAILALAVVSMAASAHAGVVLTGTPTLSISAENNSVYGAGSYLAVAGQYTAGKSYYQEWGFLEIGASASVFPKAYQVADVTSINIGLYNSGSVGDTGYGETAGNFDVYVLPDDSTDFRNARFDANDPQGLNGQFGANAQTKLGTAYFDGTPGMVHYTFSNLSSTAQQAIVNDLNNNTPIRLAIVPDSNAFAADWEGVMGYSGGAANPTISITLDPVGGNVREQVAFSAPGYTVNNNLIGGQAVFSVVRTGNATDAVAVHYATSNGTAAAGTNYTATSGTLSFAAGQTTATVVVPIIDVNGVGNLGFNLTLSNPTGGTNLTLGSQSSATVMIVDSSAMGSGNLTSALTQGGTVEVSGSFGAFANVSGSYQGSFWQTLSVLEFSPSSLGMQPGQSVLNLTGLSLQLYNTATTGNYAGTPGNFNIYYIPDANSPVGTSFNGNPYAFIYDGAYSVNGLNGQGGAGPATLLGTFSFNNQAGYDTFTPASIPQAVKQDMIADLNSGGNLRLAITPGTSDFKVDWNGTGVANQKPTLTLSATVSQTAQVETLAFIAPSYAVNEANGPLTITVARHRLHGRQCLRGLCNQRRNGPGWDELHRGIRHASLRREPQQRKLYRSGFKRDLPGRQQGLYGDPQQSHEQQQSEQLGDHPSVLGRRDHRGRPEHGE